MTPQRLEVWAVDWPEILPGTDLATLVASIPDLRDGDVAVISSKVVSKAEGRSVARDRADVVADESVRVVARRAATVIAQTRHGLVMAAAGVDASNVPGGVVLTLPLDPDATARSIRDSLADAGLNVAVVITDTAGRAWRNGQTDLAIGCAGLPPLVDLAGSVDTEGSVLLVTAPAIADELAAAADLVKGKVTRRPLAVIRGLADLVLATGDHGPGAAALPRPADADLFGLGSREAARAALGLDPEAAGYFPRLVPGDPDPFAGVVSTRDDVDVTIVTVGDSSDPSGWDVSIAVTSTEPHAYQELGRIAAQIDALSVAYALVVDATRSGHDDVTADAGKAGWRLTRA